MNDFLCKSVGLCRPIQAGGKDVHVNANQLYDMAGAGGTEMVQRMIRRANLFKEFVI